MYMEPVLDGNSEIGAHVKSNLYYLTCCRHLIRSMIVTNLIFVLRKDIFAFHVRAICAELPSNISTLVLTPFLGSSLAWRRIIMGHLQYCTLFHYIHYSGVNLERGNSVSVEVVVPNTFMQQDYSYPLAESLNNVKLSTNSSKLVQKRPISFHACAT